MSAQEKFEKAEEIAKTLRTVRNYVKEARDADEGLLHTEASQNNVDDAIDFITQWEAKLDAANADEEDIETLRDTRFELEMFKHDPTACDVEMLAHSMKELYYTMVAHTTLLYVQKEKQDALDAKDDATFQ